MDHPSKWRTPPDRFIGGAVLGLLLMLSLPALGAYREGAGYVAGTTPDGRGRLIALDADNNKYLLHLEGSSYDMGFQHGYLLGEAVVRMDKEYIQSVFKSMTGVALSNKQIDFITWPFMKPHLDSIPEPYLEEMHGIVDGVVASGWAGGADEKEVELLFHDVVRINLGADVLLSMLYPLEVPAMQLMRPFKGLHACDGFVAYGRATIDGRVIMGRDFMFPPDPWSKLGLVIEYQPDDGLDFVSIAAPGMVSVSTGMNSRGIGIGVDMLYSLDVNYFKVGMGSGLLAREAIQHTGELNESVALLGGTKLGCSWLFLVGDGQGDERGGVVVEKSTHRSFPRYADYQYPKSFRKTALYPQQIEHKDDVVILANFYVNPWMNLATAAYPLGQDRYAEILKLIDQSYGRIGPDQGRDIINYLKDFRNYQDGDKVQVTVTLLDLQNLELWSLYGYYGDPWVHYQLPR